MEIKHTNTCKLNQGSAGYVKITILHAADGPLVVILRQMYYFLSMKFRFHGEGKKASFGLTVFSLFSGKKLLQKKAVFPVNHQKWNFMYFWISNYNKATFVYLQPKNAGLPRISSLAFVGSLLSAIQAHIIWSIIIKKHFSGSSNSWNTAASQNEQ